MPRSQFWGAFASAALVFVPAAGAVQVSETPFGVLDDGTEVPLFTLSNEAGTVVKLTSYGATFVDLQTADRDGELDHVVLGADSLETLARGIPAASVIGRYANRIAGAAFTIDGERFEITRNSGANHIHGGHRNFAKVVWDAEAVEDGVWFTYVSADGEEGFPGELTVSVTYTLDERSGLNLHYRATTTRPTVLNLTNHAYFNLAGSGSCEDHVLQIFAQNHAPTGPGLIPTGAVESVLGTPLDFTEPRRVGDRIRSLGGGFRGYDHGYLLPPTKGEVRLAAVVYEPSSGRVMEVETDTPGVQLYTGNHVNQFTGIGGAQFGPYGGLCLETQFYPDSPHHAHFPSTILRPDEVFESRTVFRFSVRD